MNQETIASIITGASIGAVSGIRISGDRAFSIANALFSGDVFSFASHTAHYGKILDEKGEVVDTVLLIPMKGPKSYTGEDTVEIFCHGGSILPKKILQLILQKGARLAKPGEFTLRAFLHKKIDLAQAEAVQSLIAAQNDFASKAAKNQLEGKLSQKIAFFQKRITYLSAILEAWVDFPEEDLAFLPSEEFLEILSSVIEEIKMLLSTFTQKAKLQEGISLAILGPPNAGKSSLMNYLLQKEKAIVTEIAGTTRDVLEEDFLLKGYSFRLIDTAGIRDTSCVIEQKGIEKAKQKAKEADFILYLMDASSPSFDFSFISEISPSKSLLVWNKIDKKPPPEALKEFPSVAISVKEEIGIHLLLDTILSFCNKTPLGKEEVFITSERHKKALEDTLFFLTKVKSSFVEKTSAEFLAADIKEALYSLSSILGTNVTEDVLDAIFSQFCLGK